MLMTLTCKISKYHFWIGQKCKLLWSNQGQTWSNSNLVKLYINPSSNCLTNILEAFARHKSPCSISHEQFSTKVHWNIIIYTNATLFCTSMLHKLTLGVAHVSWACFTFLSMTNLTHVLAWSTHMILSLAHIAYICCSWCKVMFQAKMHMKRWCLW
jgi:hypothetical protein